MASSVPSLPDHSMSTRQVLSRRQVATVDALLAAGLDLVREVGFQALSLREIAARAGVTHTTAYHYFTSKEHLIAELDWRMLRALPTPSPDPALPLGTRLMESLRENSRRFMDEDRLAEAVLAALVAKDPEIQRIRDQMGAELLRRVRVAIGEDEDPRLADGALLLYCGAMLQAGLGYFTFDQVVERIGEVASLLFDPSVGPTTGPG